MSDILTLQKQLVERALPSGFEHSVGELLSSLAAPFTDEVYTDTLGNVICHKKGTGKKIMLSAHMDTIGFMISYIDEKGYLRLETIGGHVPAFLLRTPVRFPNGTKGVIMCEKWGEEAKKKLADVRLTSFYIDIGAGSREKAEELVSIGDVAVFDSDTTQQGDKILTPYADDLVACIVLLKTMESLPESPYDLYFVFSVQEEVGLRGAGTSAYGIHPDMGIALDVCGTGDTPSSTAYCDVKLGKGPTVKIRDASLLCNPQVISFLRDAAERAGVVYQDEILLSGGTDAGAMQRTKGGIMAGAVSIPTRNVHSPREIYSISDVEGAVKLLVSALGQ
ncbi:MAG: M20/M25/M40 family metallo-hydrolase [Clostridiaceae bacterium]|nr:M20/M25/M40 family metallo-hydrolase [Clostridiaceae bacterium]